MHLGASFSWRGLFDLIEDNNTFIRSRPEVGLTDVRYVDTGDLPGINHISRFGLEAAFQAGPLSFQAEYIRTFLSRLGNAYGDAAFEGGMPTRAGFPSGGPENTPRPRPFSFIPTSGPPGGNSKWPRATAC